MPDEQGNDLTDEDEVPKTSLHAHDDGREDDVKGSAEPEVGEEGDLDEEGPGNPVGDSEGGASDEEE
jgi:hypothetical protein